MNYDYYIPIHTHTIDFIQDDYIVRYAHPHFFL